jgi:hypothetical protein
MDASLPVFNICVISFNTSSSYFFSGLPFDLEAIAGK